MAKEDLEVITFESIPSSLKEATTIPIYKGKGWHALLTKNYRGISLSSIIGKRLEQIVLVRMTPILEESGIPHKMQRAFQAGNSCADAMEAVQEAV